MKPIEKQELYEHVSGFLNERGIHLTSGSYADGIKKSCSLLADAINLSQKGLDRAKVQINDTLSNVRQAIHEKTAPKSPPAPPPPRKAAAAKPGPRAKKTGAKRSKTRS